MKFLIASDIHGDIKCAEAVIREAQKICADKILLLGDVLYHGPRNDLPENYNPKAVITLLNSNKDKFVCVRGNCDAEVDQMVLDFPISADYQTISDGRVKIALSHGHVYSPSKLPPEDGVSLFLYGHTHVQKIEWANDTLCVNPGSVTLPKENNPKTYAIYEDGIISIYDFDGNCINSAEI